jgi:hypothetical protein
MEADHEAEMTERWETIYKLAKAAARRASKVSGKDFQAPNLEVAKAKLLFHPPRQGIPSPKDQLIASAVPMDRITMLENSILFANGDCQGFTVVRRSVIVCSGNIEQITDIRDSVVILTGRLKQTTHMTNNFIQAQGLDKAPAGLGNVYVNVDGDATKPADREKVASSDRGPLQLFRFLTRRRWDSNVERSATGSRSTASATVCLSPRRGFRRAT